MRAEDDPRPHTGRRRPRKRYDSERSQRRRFAVPAGQTTFGLWKSWWWRVGLYAGFCSGPCGPVVAIHLGRRLPDGSSGLPGVERAGRPPPARPCSGWGLPSHPGHPGCWCALTAPFHPYLCGRRRPRHRRSALCCTFLRVAPTGCYPAPCPVESGRSSDGSPSASGPVRGHPADSPPPPFWPARLRQ